MKQEVYSGSGGIKELKNIVGKYNAGSIFLVTHARSFKMTGAENYFKSELRNKYAIHQFNDYSETPRLGDVEKGIFLFRAKKPDITIAVGGGNTIDTAKLINVLSCQDYPVINYVNHKSRIAKKGRPLIVLPTTVGSGSEATRFAVMYVDKKKYSIEHNNLRPDVVILDPELTLSLPAGVIASSGMDALSQAVESYWSVNSNPESKEYAGEAINILFHNMVDAFGKKDPSMMKDMMSAAYLSGSAINITKTTAPHAISYTLTSHFGVSHGQAVGLILPSFFEYNHNVSEEDCMDKRGVGYVKGTIEKICRMFGCDDPVSVKNKVRGLMSRIGLQTRLSQVGIREQSHIDLIVKNVNAERLMNNPRAVTKEQVRDLLVEMM